MPGTKAYHLVDPRRNGWLPRCQRWYAGTKVERRIRLRDGRHIGVCEHGLREGRPVIWLVGTGGSRRWSPPDRDAAGELGVRLVVVERPGFGVSEHKPGRRILDWPDDLAEVLDGIGIERGAIAGPSGAGPYLCASALRLPERCSLVGLVGCLAPPGAGYLGMSARRRAILYVAARAPWMIEQALRGRSPARIYRDMTADAPPSDRAIIDRPEVWRAQVEMLDDALQSGIDGFVWELHLGARPWGFALADIRVPVRVWHGTKDAAAPIAMAHCFAHAIPSCQTTLVEGAGHFLHYDRWRAILAELSQAGQLAGQSPA